jgi:molecular chaperone GrpE
MKQKIKNETKMEEQASSEINIEEVIEQEIVENKEVKVEEEEEPVKKSKKEKAAEKISNLEETLVQTEDKYLRLQAEFDNYRKRTLKEKMELTKSAGESILMNILPVIDDFERALQSMNDAKEEGAVKEGIELIYKRFKDFMTMNGIKEIEAKEQTFDTDLHEAITKIPAPTEDLKGKVVDVIQKGYLLNDKVIRFAKVVIGE